MPQRDSTYTTDGEEQAGKLGVLGGANAEETGGVVEGGTSSALVLVVSISSEEDEGGACKYASEDWIISTGNVLTGVDNTSS